MAYTPSDSIRYKKSFTIFNLVGGGRKYISRSNLKMRWCDGAVVGGVWLKNGHGILW